MNDPILETRALTRHFGGLYAVNQLDLSIQRGSAHGILGPNGAGKTTLVNLLSGELHANSGSIHFNGTDISRWPAHRVSQFGIGRSYQRTNIYPAFSCFENCWMAAQSRERSSMRFFKPAYHRQELHEKTLHWLSLCHLADQASTPAKALSYGEQRQLEIAMVLATEPTLLLLDEPMAGMGRKETDRTVELLNRLRKDYTLLLVEHDMDAVFAICDRLTVMVDGRELETGDLDEVRSSPAVQEAYLGESRVRKDASTDFKD